MTSAASPSALAAHRSTAVRLDAALLAAVWLLLSVASGYRWFGPGPDYLVYQQFYGSLSLDNFYRDERFEPLFVASAWVFKYLLRSEFQLFITVLVSLSLAIKLRLIYRRTRWPLLAGLTYLMIFYMLHEYTQIRQALAIAFGLLSIEAYIERRYVRSLLFIGLGVMFQSSVAILGLGVLLSNFLVLGRLGAALGLTGIAYVAPLATTIGGALFIARFFPAFSIYVGDFLQYEPLNLASGPNILFAAMLTVTIPLVSATDRPRMMYAIMCLLAVVAFVVLLDFPVLAQRFRDIYAVFGILLAFSFPLRSFGSLAVILTIVSGLWSLSRVSDILQA